MNNTIETHNEQFIIDDELRERYHAVDYVMESSTLSRDYKVAKITRLFPDFNDDASEDEFMSEFTIDQYYYSRSLGMSLKDAAMTIEVSYLRIAGFLVGRRLSLEKFYALIKAELRALPSLKQKLLRQLERQGTAGNGASNELSAALALLNKLETGHSSGQSVALNVYLKQ
jgi:hypothetical protein